MTCGDNISNALYGRGMDELIARGVQVNGAWQGWWYFPDRNGNISLVTDGLNTVRESYRYDAFGLPTITVGAGQPAINNRFLFTGREWNATYGFYEYRARAYNPTLGRFMSEDPKGFDAGDYNLYRYCKNDPLDKTDPMGLDPGDPFPTALAAGQDAVRFTNPTSIRQNLEYGGFIYKLDGKYYAQQAQHLEEREGGATKGTLHGPLPPHSTVAGNYHDHADYSRKEGGKVVRTTRDKDGYDSDHFSKSDKKEMSAFAKGQEEHTAVLGTPSGQIRAIDFKSDKLKEETVGKTEVPAERQKTGN
jgi:RHS repeat-associated protein